MIELLSIDLSNYCSKQCSFCYNHSTRQGNTLWKPDEVVAFASDCVEHGVKAVSLGGGEPFEYDGVFTVIGALYPKCYLSITSNGLPLEEANVWQQLEHCKPDKIHITIHHPDDSQEVDRVEAGWCRQHRCGPRGLSSFSEAVGQRPSHPRSPAFLKHTHPQTALFSRWWHSFPEPILFTRLSSTLKLLFRIVG